MPQLNDKIREIFWSVRGEGGRGSILQNQDSAAYQQSLPTAIPTNESDGALRKGGQSVEFSSLVNVTGVYKGSWTEVRAGENGSVYNK